MPAGAPAPIAVVGTTASGKSALALALARRRSDVELVSVDSMQVYRGMDIGTAKPTPAERAEVPHHLLDLVDPWDPYEVHSFQQAARRALADIAERDRRAVLVGGTGLYLRAVLDGFEIPGRYPEILRDLEAETDTTALHRRLAVLDPVAASRMEPNNRRRVLRALEVTVGSGRPFSSYGPGLDHYPPTPVVMVGIRRPTDVVADRISRRYEQQMADGFLDEVYRLAAGPPLGRTASQALGYRELLAHLREPADSDSDRALAAAVEVAIGRTRGFARRQRSWFGRDPRITWLDAGADADDTYSDVLVRDLADIAARSWGPPTA